MPSECIATLTRGCALAAACITATACSTARPDRVDERSCPPRPPAVYAALDVSDTGRSPALVAERLGAVRDLLTDAATCRGHAAVVAFSSSAAATEVLLDRELRPEGATRRAQLRRIPKLVDEAMDEVRGRLDAAADHLPAGGTDVLAQLGLAAEFHHRAGADRPLRVVIWSDGIATAPIDFSRQAELDPARGRAVAQASSPPTSPTTRSRSGALVAPPAASRPPRS